MSDTNASPHHHHLEQSRAQVRCEPRGEGPCVAGIDARRVTAITV